MSSLLPPAALALLLSASLAAGNLLENPGFEQNASRWDFFVPESAKDHGNTFVVVPAEGVDGGAVARLTSPVSSRCGLAQKNIPVTGWTRCRVTFWFKAEKGVEYKNGPIVRLNFRSSGEESDTDDCVGLGGHTGSDYKEVKRPDWLPLAWEKVEAVVESPVDAKTLSLCFFSWGIKGSVHFDDLPVAAVAPAAR
jgi:hypothetical protein